jgi:DNA polymerase delta subunit 4
MPPRRKATTRGATAAQSTLSFAGKSRVTKPTTLAPTGKKLKDDADVVISDVVADEFQTPEAEEPKTAEIAIREPVKQREVEVEPPKDAAEVEAQRIDETRLKEYWRDREAERKTPRGTISRSGC